MDRADAGHADVALPKAARHRIDTWAEQTRSVRIQDVMLLTAGDPALLNALAGLLASNGVVTVTNAVIAWNRGDKSWNGDGVILWNSGSSVHIVNSTIVSNTAEGVDALEGFLDIRNTVFVGNRGGIQNYQSGATVTSDFNIFWNNGWPYHNVTQGPHDQMADPLFRDVTRGDFRLQETSPCLDAGTTEGAPAVDIRGMSRDATPDIGAYERMKHRIFLPLTLKHIIQ